ncbi:MAG: ATP-binding protein [Kiritimatiellae bacterium]|nr:ATP-binding protein [Kiritimatiellia bacterium]
MRRKITETLRKWREADATECALLIDGARRVGKSFIVEEFAKAEYPAYLMINFKYVGSDVKETFHEYLNRLDMFFERLFLVLDKKPLPKGSLVIFDEVQEFPRAREAIKPLVADGRYQYIETGSLISIKKNVEGILIPSEERHVKMYPMDFEEFLWANGEESLMDVIRDAFSRRVPLGPLHRRAMDAFRTYMLVGGMPQAVRKYVETHDFEKVDRTKRDILGLYRSAIAKYAGANALKVESMWDAIPAQLSRHEKSYNLADIADNARMREYEDPAFWLKDAMTCNFCYNATEPNLGLSLSADHTTFKCYMADTGLLVSHAFDENELVAEAIHKRLLTGDISVNEGMIMENVVAQILVASGRKLYFYARSDPYDRKERLEIDFLIAKSKLARKNNVSAIEVKSGKRVRPASLRKFQAKFAEFLAEPFVFHAGDVRDVGAFRCLPLYMAACL